MPAGRDDMDSERIPWPGGATAAVVLTFDVDAESGVLWEFPDTARRLGIMSHQAYGPRAGLPRLLRVLARHGARATFFVPGFTADAHPDAVRGIVDAGHEIGHHGYVHEIVTELTPADEEAVLERGAEALERLTGVRPRGWRAPMWELNYHTPALLAAHGFAYDSSLMDSDVPYRLATGPQKGAPTLVEIPPHWSLDDGEQYAWLPGIWDTAVIEGPDKLLRMWEMDFEADRRRGRLPRPDDAPVPLGAARRARRRSSGSWSGSSARPGVWVATAAEVADHVDALALEPVLHEPPPIDPSDLARRIAARAIHRRLEGGRMNDLASAASTPRAAGYAMPAEWWPHERCLISWPTRVARVLGRVLPARPGDARRRRPRRRPLRAGARHRQPRRGRQRGELLRLATTSRSSSCPSTTRGSATTARTSCSARTAGARSPTSPSTRGARSTSPTTRTPTSRGFSASTSAGSVSPPR